MYSDGAGWIPGFGSYLGGGDNTVEEVLASGGDVYYSGASDFFFQVVFVATAASIMSETHAKRIRFWPFLAFTLVLTAFIYPIQVHWSWGGTALGGLMEGLSDFAGSTIVHSVWGWAALAGAILLGARKGKYGPDGKVNAIPGSNLPLATLGTFILWLGWFGFNGGSQLALGSKGDADAISAVFCQHKHCGMCRSSGGYDSDPAAL